MFPSNIIDSYYKAKLNIQNRTWQISLPEMHFSSSNQELIISGLNRSQILEILADGSLLAEIRNILGNANFSDFLQVSFRSKEGYSYRIVDLYHGATSMNIAQSIICQRLQEILDLPESTAITTIETDKIIAGSKNLAKQVQFLHEMDMIGVNSRDGWLSHEYSKMRQILDGLPFGGYIGTPESPYEYQAISMPDILSLIKQGYEKEAAIAEARKINLGVVFQKELIGHCPVRVMTLHYFSYR